MDAPKAAGIDFFFLMVMIAARLLISCV